MKMVYYDDMFILKFLEFSKGVLQYFDTFVEVTIFRV